MDPGGKLVTDPPELDPEHLNTVFFKPAPHIEVRFLGVHSVQQSPLQRIRETTKFCVLVFQVLCCVYTRSETLLIPRKQKVDKWGLLRSKYSWKFYVLVPGRVE
jgi:hypothetical protein